MKNPVSYIFTGFIVAFGYYSAEEEGFEPPEV